MESHWIINLSKNGRHYFHVKIVGYDAPEMKAVYNDLKTRFPECRVTVTRWSASGTSVTPEDTEL